MTTQGVTGVFIETHNRGKSATFSQAGGFELDLKTDHASAQLRDGDGPYVLVAEIPEDRDPQAQLELKLANADAFRVERALEMVTQFEDTHDGAAVVTDCDPNGRRWSFQVSSMAVPEEAVYG
jgi:hypothetical protein